LSDCDESRPKVVGATRFFSVMRPDGYRPTGLAALVEEEDDDDTGSLEVDLLAAVEKCSLGLRRSQARMPPLVSASLSELGSVCSSLEVEVKVRASRGSL